jgi:probable HAF family extracellular repeat protein
MGAGMPMMLGPFTPRGINNTGVIVGEMAMAPGYAAAHAVRWQNGVLTDLGTLGGEQSAAYAIAENGRIVGLSRPANDGPPHAVLWQNGAIIDLGTLGGPISHAWDLNESGQIVGFAATAAGEHHAVLYEVAANGSVQSVRDLGELGGAFSYAQAINEAGMIVGSADTRAVRWMASAKAGPEDLNDLTDAAAQGWELMVATDVNDQGRITGYGKHDGFFRGFLLRPIAPADLDGSGTVDALDFLLLLSAWGDCPAPCPPSCLGDINDDCTVDALDYLMLIAQWGS